MIAYKTYKVELIPNGEDIRKFKQFCGCARFVYNLGLALQMENYKQGRPYISSYTITKNIKQWQIEYPWLKSCYIQCLHNALNNLDKAYKLFFKKASGFPTFKKKKGTDSVTFRINAKHDSVNHRIHLPKIGWIKYKNHRKIEGKIKFITVKHICDKWFAFIKSEINAHIPIPQGEAIGIDLGVTKFATLSNGTFYKPINALKNNNKKLVSLQRQLDHKVKFSKNWHKIKNKISKLHHRIANIRHDYIHKVTTEISKNHALVVMEDLKIMNMTKSATGTVEKPGKNTKSKTALNRAILDQGWGYFKRWLDYKLALQGGHLVLVSPINTSRTCPDCGCVSKDNRTTQASFKCVDCGYTNNADIVGAINILRAGYARLACEVSNAVRLPAAGTQRGELATCS